MIVFPNAKINIGLQIKSKRADGFHDLETIFYPIKLKDILEITRDKSNIPTEKPSVNFAASGTSIPNDGAENICLKAFQLLQKDFPEITNCQMYLHKAIPVGAGLGGGSSDAAHALMVLNKIFNLNLSQPQLHKYAAMLGSDCPFFIDNKPSYATGRGELLTPSTISLSGYKIYLVHPGIHINTAWAFSTLKIHTTHHCDLNEAVQRPVHQWQQHIYNDFETPVFAAHPPIKAIKDQLLNSGALYAAMSGSGSSVYGIFDDSANPTLNFPAHYFTNWV